MQKDTGANAPASFEPLVYVVFTCLYSFQATF